MPADSSSLHDLLGRVRACTVCSAHVAAGPRPIGQIADTARILIIGQAPGARVHASGVPWEDASGERQREWTGLTPDLFYDASQVALMPMGFCFPGAKAGGDLPPRPECAPLWHDALMACLPPDRLTLLVGTYAQKRYAGPLSRLPMTEIVRRQGELPPGIMALPHPAWRSTLWMAQNPWFETDILPRLRVEIAARLAAAT